MPENLEVLYQELFRAALEYREAAISYTSEYSKHSVERREVYRSGGHPESRRTSWAKRSGPLNERKKKAQENLDKLLGLGGEE